MKPHIRKRYGVWICYMAQRVHGWYHSHRSTYIQATPGRLIGHGYTPREAYADWQEQTRAARSAATK